MEKGTTDAHDMPMNTQRVRADAPNREIVIGYQVAIAEAAQKALGSTSEFTEGQLIVPRACEDEMANAAGVVERVINAPHYG